MAKLITVCLWSLYDACKLLDACGLQLTEDEAEDPMLSRGENLKMIF